jgi:hypothetical protein
MLENIDLKHANPEINLEFKVSQNISFMIKYLTTLNIEHMYICTYIHCTLNS